jgi:hypothetical protein
VGGVQVFLLLTLLQVYFTDSDNSGPKPVVLHDLKKSDNLKPRRLGVRETPEARGFFF